MANHSTVEAVVGDIAAAAVTELASDHVTVEEPVNKGPEAMPYITVSGPVSRVRMASSAPKPAPLPDGRPNGLLNMSVLVQVDVWRQRGPTPADPFGTPEDSTWVDRIERRLLASAPVPLSDGTICLRFSVDSSVLMFDASTRIVHEAITVRVVRTA